MLGSFAAAAADIEAVESYAFMRSRIGEYFADQGLTVRLPDTHREYSDAPERWNERIWRLSAAVSPVAHRFCIAGSMAYYTLSERTAEPELAQQVYEDLVTQLAPYTELSELNKTVLMLAEKGFESPSNLNYHAIVAYDPKGDSWPASAIETSVVMLRGALAGRDRRLERERAPRRQGE